MSNRVLKSALLLAFAAFGAIAQAQEEPPSRVGRIAVAQGQVSISGDTGEAAQAATVNWPVSEHDLITTARGARTELRIGSTAIRLDGDSSLEVTELDDNSMRLRLHYGTASIRITNPEVLGGFELSTPQGRIRMQEPGRIRVDAERTPDTSSVTVFDGVAMVEGGGASINLRAGKRAELRDDDVRTAQAGRDGFDDWSASRDRIDERVTSTRYITTEMTGYEELDRYGSWRMDNEYGPVWIPTVATTWVPYRDGRWVWVNPWGWTWVDNAPWGYAPFHYGRWVHLNNRWCWVPGRRDAHPAWAPALVGWVGGGGWSVNFNFSNRHHAMPATGWYPLSPRDHFVPHFRASDDYVRRANRDWRQDRDRRDPRDNDYRHRGLTVVPQDHFGKRGLVEVPKAPLAVVPPRALPPQPAATPPAPPPSVRDWRRERSEDRFERRADHQREQRAVMPAPVLSNQPQPVTAVTPPPQVRPLMPNRPEPRQPVTVATPAPSLQPNQPQPQWRAPEPRQPVTVVTPMPPQMQQQPSVQPRPREDREEQFEERRGRWGRHLSTDMAEGRPQPQPPAGIAQPRFERPAPQPQPQPQPPASIAQQRFERPMPQPQPQPVAAPPQPRPMPQPMPAPAAQPAPAPAAVAAPQPRPSPSPRAEDRGRRGEDGLRQQER